ncbi:MAG: hypothetical protein A2912_01320 [Candidatus Buchananbacteria bacterium RIFCSPLOWO2_01_FULL_40_23b]|uniref:NACHT domain-containing protein n=1 Tax=Candidatus Buchananbacteria bacterium RIFCSPLOWO2_01_FULL_40_23b TaxID=1797544 RepID=A0A1G1YTQ5_9BACT|nr:MAG: hypothetical protein A2912_01320 [Candidatus Buchananbacteria bacterium RIFCSPLOWO2_01_FULL_40_23b]
MSELELKLKLWAQQYEKVPHPLYLGKWMSFLKPVLQNTIGTEINEQELVQPGINILIGDGGSGKSTLAKHLTYKIEEGDIPSHPSTTALFIPLNERFAQMTTPQNLYEHLSTCTFPLFDQPPQEYQKLFETSKPLLIFDGLDEIVEPNARAHTLNFITQHFSSHHVLLTSRPNPTILSKPHYTIKSTTKENALQYAQWISIQKRDGERTYQDFQKCLEESTYKEIILSNPALFEYARIIHEHGRTFGDNVVDFFERIVHDLVAPTMGTIFKTDEFSSSPIHHQYALRVFDKKYSIQSWGIGTEYDRAIKYIAYQMTLQQKRNLPLSDFVNMLNELFEFYSEFNQHRSSQIEQHQMTHALLFYTPLFTEFETNVYGFRSLTLQDIIGINELSKGMDVIKDYHNVIAPRDPKTQELFFLCLAYKGAGYKTLADFKKKHLEPASQEPFKNAVNRLDPHYHKLLQE